MSDKPVRVRRDGIWTPAHLVSESGGWGHVRLTTRGPLVKVRMTDVDRTNTRTTHTTKETQP